MFTESGIREAAAGDVRPVEIKDLMPVDMFYT
jgi:hypothetical protein